MAHKTNENSRKKDRYDSDSVSGSIVMVYIERNFHFTIFAPRKSQRTINKKWKLRQLSRSTKYVHMKCEEYKECSSVDRSFKLLPNNRLITHQQLFDVRFICLESFVSNQCSSSLIYVRNNDQCYITFDWPPSLQTTKQ